MAGAPLSYPAQYPNIYAYGKAHSLQVLPSAIAPTFAIRMATARRAAGPRVPQRQTPLAAAQNARSGRAMTQRLERQKGAPHRRRGYAESGYGMPSGKQ
jgi:hypothetical protein